MLSDKAQKRFSKMDRTKRDYAQRIHNHFHNAGRFHWEASFINSHLNGLREEDCWKRLPQYVQYFLEGVIHHCRHSHEKLLVFSYLVNGKRLAITSDEYRKVSPHYIHELCSDTGAHVYKEDTDKIYS